MLGRARAEDTLEHFEREGLLPPEVFRLGDQQLREIGVFDDRTRARLLDAFAEAATQGRVKTEGTGTAKSSVVTPAVRLDGEGQFLTQSVDVMLCGVIVVASMSFPIVDMLGAGISAWDLATGKVLELSTLGRIVLWCIPVGGISLVLAGYARRKDFLKSSLGLTTSALVFCALGLVSEVYELAHSFTGSGSRPPIGDVISGALDLAGAGYFAMVAATVYATIRVAAGPYIER